MNWRIPSTPSTTPCPEAEELAQKWRTIWRSRSYRRPTQIQRRAPRCAPTQNARETGPRNPDEMETEMTLECEMPRYQSHKKVWALKIRDITLHSNGTAIIMPEEGRYTSFTVDASYVLKHAPQAGGYYVVYDDGYKSWSPAEAFESGYTRLS
ncbi:hypothetical protein ACELLULO517_07645 [Acidisoma cellulosilytica]|uniref:Uncharacterized protein n=1 Tax=Acidisoma cellulosilyticum TaxID=2802395 RepID=A0A963Z062_9PROT|nr:hypothetical protein [Acidisoma cellulosilyticum]MCB8880104.1 hypothetical protein [Acidisoma cellulosilyticum]